MNKTSKNIRLGLFVVSGTILLVLSLYLIGSKQNLFGDTFKISARFYNVEGLMKGNNVRFAGIDIGTVESIDIINDTTVKVTMILDRENCKFIKQNAIASVGTDGLMGNKLVNIDSRPGTAPQVKEGDELASLHPVEMDGMIRTLNVTNENIMMISSNLRTITDRINSKNSLWSLLMDTVVSENIKSAVVNLKLMSNKSVMITGDLHHFTQDIKAGKGSIGALITDTLLSSRISQAVINFSKFSDTAAVLSGDLSQIVKDLRQGKGSMGVLLKDTNLVHDLNKSIQSLDKGATSFDENMEALHHTWPLKKYYRKQTKK